MSPAMFAEDQETTSAVSAKLKAAKTIPTGRWSSLAIKKFPSHTSETSTEAMSSSSSSSFLGEASSSHDENEVSGRLKLNDDVGRNIKVANDSSQSGNGATHVVSEIATSASTLQDTLSEHSTSTMSSSVARMPPGKSAIFSPEDNTDSFPKQCRVSRRSGRSTVSTMRWPSEQPGSGRPTIGPHRMPLTGGGRFRDKIFLMDEKMPARKHGEESVNSQSREDKNDHRDVTVTDSDESADEDSKMSSVHSLANREGEDEEEPPVEEGCGPLVSVPEESENEARLSRKKRAAVQRSLSQSTILAASQRNLMLGISSRNVLERSNTGGSYDNVDRRALFARGGRSQSHYTDTSNVRRLESTSSSSSKDSSKGCLSQIEDDFSEVNSTLGGSSVQTGDVEGSPTTTSPTDVDIVHHPNPRRWRISLVRWISERWGSDKDKSLKHSYGENLKSAFAPQEANSSENIIYDPNGNVRKAPIPGSVERVDGIVNGKEDFNGANVDFFPRVSQGRPFNQRSRGGMHGSNAGIRRNPDERILRRLSSENEANVANVTRSWGNDVFLAVAHPISDDGRSSQSRNTQNSQFTLRKNLLFDKRVGACFVFGIALVAALSAGFVWERTKLNDIKNRIRNTVEPTPIPKSSIDPFPKDPTASPSHDGGFPERPYWTTLNPTRNTVEAPTPPRVARSVDVKYPQAFGAIREEDYRYVDGCMFSVRSRAYLEIVSFNTTLVNRESIPVAIYHKLGLYPDNESFKNEWELVAEPVKVDGHGRYNFTKLDLDMEKPIKMKKDSFHSFYVTTRKNEKLMIASKGVRENKLLATSPLDEFEFQLEIFEGVCITYPYAPKSAELSTPMRWHGSISAKKPGFSAYVVGMCTSFWDNGDF